MEEVGHGLLIKQLAIGTVVIAVTVGIHAEMLALLTRHYDGLMAIAREKLGRWSRTGVLMIGMLYVMFVMTIEVWLWAGVLMLTGAVPRLEPSVYFALVSFTTLGYGDITLSQDWRLMAGLIGANGFLLFGWSTAYMVELVRRTG